MSYDLAAIEQACVKHGVSFQRRSESEIDVDVLPEGALTLANIDHNTDTYLGFRGCPWHSHGVLMLMDSQASHVEYSPEALIGALASGEVLVVSQYYSGQLKDRWLTHRNERVDLQYVEPGEELRICQMAMRK